MKFKYTLSKDVLEFVKDAKLKDVNIGCSDSQVVEIHKNEKIYFLKIMKSGLLENEYKRLKWLQDKLPVPQVIMYSQENGNDYLITLKMHGEMLCSDYYINNPDIAIKVLVEAFNNLYSVDISNCPFDVSNNYKLSLVRERVEKGLVSTSDLKKDTIKKFGTVNNLLSFLEENRPKEELTVSHGDTSLPNIFAEKDKFEGFIDTGDCGIADKWFDLAICEKSIRRNYGDKYVKKFYDELNIKRDEGIVNYYLYMMELYP